MTFLSILPFFCTDLTIPTKNVYFRRLYLQSLKVHFQIWDSFGEMKAL